MRKAARWSLLAIVSAALLVPVAPAGSDTNTRTAPYDWGHLCYKLIYPFTYSSLCFDDLATAKTGVLASVAPTKGFQLDTPAYSEFIYTPRAWRAASGVYFQSSVPGTLKMSANVVGTAQGYADVCLVLSAADPVNAVEKSTGTEVCKREAATLHLANQLQITSTQRYLIQVAAQTSYGYLAGVIVKDITYEFIPDGGITTP